MQKKIYWSWAFKQIQMLGVMFGWGVNFFLEKVQFSSCHLNSRTPVHTLLHIWKKICAHLAKDLLGILQFAFMPRRADNDAGPRVFGGNLWLQGRNTGLLQKQLLQSQKQIYCFQVYFHPQDWQHNMWGLIPWWSRGCLHCRLYNFSGRLRDASLGSIMLEIFLAPKIAKILNSSQSLCFHEIPWES